MITLKQLTTNHPDYPQVVKLYEEAFPENERVMDMPTLLSGFPVTLLGIYPEEELFAGFFLVFDDGTLLYLLFFATCPQMRSGGIGSKAMQALVEKYRGRQLMFCYERASTRVPGMPNSERRSLSCAAPRNRPI